MKSLLRGTPWCNWILITILGLGATTFFYFKRNSQWKINEAQWADDVTQWADDIILLMWPNEKPEKQASGSLLYRSFSSQNHACFGGPHVIHVICSFARFLLRNDNFARFFLGTAV